MLHLVKPRPFLVFDSKSDVRAVFAELIEQKNKRLKVLKNLTKTRDLILQNQELNGKVVDIATRKRLGR